mmetsp:Transcript_27809/g.24605  ORF Transcript_27809/g.24605 Transcript_27809/m.24605 type:complete len:374 (+) Transcript_27809:54-1175(+)|eukprot:CAMPEP_0201585496 /NCGR_PEP_ID=MMETSP0190_2-20130828/122650_1 /ASSEMBLY_ACC=CAM_ASM_000263 /TAXON_ID=37353 /ORGANISM="Rosalina sp." /LENGTH=373 /DNA_ID=CAMNT_0048031553 /DNA_START=28 /DNA_END=1149 /DNA_ORIENTATION=+
MKPALVLDCGSGAIKAGLSNAEMPTNIIPSVCGRHRSITGDDNQNQNDAIYYGNLALQKRGLISLRYPIEHGIVCNWDDMEKLLHHTFFNELRIDPKDEDVFLSEASLNPKANREKSVEILFEKFDINSVAMASQSILGLYSSGRTSGMVCESGEGVTHCIPIYEGYSLPQAIVRSDIGGRDVTDYLIKLLAEKGHKFYTTAERQIAKNMKEMICYVSRNYVKSEIAKIENDNENHYLYELPDGNNIELNCERLAPEIMFQPQLMGREQQFGLTQLINESVMKSEMDLRRTMWRNIVLSGGNTMFEGLRIRLNNELSRITPKSVDVKVDAMSNRKYCVWIGSAVLANLCRNNWMQKQQFEEFGAARITVLTSY